MNSQTQFSDDVHTTILYQCGLLLCAMTYGAHIILFLLSLRPTIKRRNRYLLAYIVVLFCIATIGFGLQAWWTLVAFIENVSYPGGPNKFLLDNIDSPANNAVTAVYIILNMLSDGIILHRFYSLCGCIIARNRRWALFFVVPSSIALIITACACFPQIASLGVSLWTGMSIAPGIAYMALSLSINTVLTLLIIGRLLYLRQEINRMFSKHSGVGHTYTSVVALLIESASLYTIVALMTVIACGVGSQMQYVLLPMLGQLQAIPPLLIISRLASGSALNEEEFSKLSTKASGRMQTISKKISSVLKSKGSLIFPDSSKGRSWPTVDTSVSSVASQPSSSTKCNSWLTVDTSVSREASQPSSSTKFSSSSTKCNTWLTIDTSVSSVASQPSSSSTIMSPIVYEKSPYAFDYGYNTLAYVDSVDNELREPERAYQYV